MPRHCRMTASVFAVWWSLVSLFHISGREATVREGWRNKRRSELRKRSAVRDSSRTELRSSDRRKLNRVEGLKFHAVNQAALRRGFSRTINLLRKSLESRQHRGSFAGFGREFFMAVTTVVRNVFVYGSLLAPEVLSALLHRVPRASLAVVHDYHRYSIKGRIYPAVSPNKGDKVFGKVLFDLSDQELHILDEFEDIEYNKVTVSSLTLKAHDADGESMNNTHNDVSQEQIGSGCLERLGNALTVPNGQADNVELEDNTVEISPGRTVGLRLATEVTAYIYVWVKQGDPDLVGNWDYEEWRTNDLKAFLEKYFGIRSAVS